METDVVGEIVDMMYAEIKQRITEKWICFVLNITQKPFSYIRKEFFEYNSTQSTRGDDFENICWLLNSIERSLGQTVLIKGHAINSILLQTSDSVFKNVTLISLPLTDTMWVF